LVKNLEKDFTTTARKTHMNFTFTDEQLMIRKTAREFALTELAPGVVERDEKKIWPKEGIAKMAELGF